MTPAQLELLRDAAAGRLTMAGVRFYRDGTQLDVHTGWIAFDLLGAGHLVAAAARSGKYQRVVPTDSGRLGLATVTAEEKS